MTEAQPPGGGDLAPLDAIAEALAVPPVGAPRPPPAAAAVVPSKRRKNTGRRSAAQSAAAAEQEELVKLGPEIARNSERLRTGWHPVQLSAEDKAAEVVLDDKQLTASSSAGYRMVRATHGTYTGTWYFEVRVDHLGPSGAARVGWCTRQAEINAPVGADAHGYAYRSVQGSKVHAAWRDDYGQPFGEGDIVGCLLHLPEGGRPFEKGAADVVKYKGKLHFVEDEQAQPQKLAGSFAAFALNGQLQGKAYTDLPEGTYCPAISLYTNKTQQSEQASVTVNFGEHGFAFPPPEIEGCPPPRPAFELSGPRPAPAPQQQQQQQQEANGKRGEDGTGDYLQQQQQQLDGERPADDVQPMDEDQGAPAQQEQQQQPPSS